MNAPKCKLCGAVHWPREPHVFKGTDAGVVVVEETIPLRPLSVDEHKMLDRALKRSVTVVKGVMRVTNEPVGNVGNVGNRDGGLTVSALAPTARVSRRSADSRKDGSKSEVERVAKWREANRERDNARRREYMKKRRAAK